MEEWVDSELLYRGLFITASILQIAIRVYYQRKVFHEKREIDIQEDRTSLVAGGLAAVTAILFGLEYIFFPGTFAFAYVLHYPDWLRWLGAVLLAGGVILLAAAHHHLDKSFSSFVVAKENQTFVDTGPYRWIRLPIYTAYLMNYIGGGLLASNWVLTFIPVILFGFMIYRRIPNEERVMEAQFGQQYIDYETQTGRLLPRANKRA